MSSDYCLMNNGGDFSYLLLIFLQNGHFRVRFEYCRFVPANSFRFQVSWVLFEEFTMAVRKAQPLIQESCEKFKKNYPDCMIGAAWKKYYDKYKKEQKLGSYDVREKAF